MYDIKNMNIWETQTTKNNTAASSAMNTDLEDLNLSVRSFNCLRRAGCSTVADVIRLIDDDETNLRKVRNLGTRSQTEILEAIRKYREMMPLADSVPQDQTPAPLIRPAKLTMDREITEFGLSEKAVEHLHACGVRKVGNLYRSTLPTEPGWYAVRELFEKVPRRSE